MKKICDMYLNDVRQEKYMKYKAMRDYHDRAFERRLSMLREIQAIGKRVSNMRMVCYFFLMVSLLLQLAAIDFQYTNFDFQSLSFSIFAINISVLIFIDVSFYLKKFNCGEDN